MIHAIKKVEEEEIKIEIKEKDIPLLFDYIFNLFYGGSMSNKKIEEYVLALIWSFLQDALNEINNEKDIMEIFNKRVGYIFKYLYKQKEIKEYFNKILSFEFKTIEFNNNGNWLFEKMKDINKETAKQIENDMDKYKNTMDETEKTIFNAQFNEKKAIYTDRIKKFKNEKLDENNNKYINKIKLKLQNQLKSEGKESFNMDEIINNFEKGDVEVIELYSHYTYSVYTAYRCVDNILSTLIDNFNEIPNLIKYILKMIYISINDKFPNIDKEIFVDVIKKFFFELLLFKLNTFPYFELIYEDNVISPETTEKTKIINNVIENFINGHFYSKSQNILYSPFNMLFFDEKLEKVFNLFNNEFYDNIQFPNKIEQFIQKESKEKWEIFNEKKNEENKKIEELTMCSFSKINSLLIDIIDSLDDDKSCNILEEKAFKAAKLRKDALKEDTFLIFQNLKFPFDINNRNIKCFNKENSFKVKNKNIEINKMTNLEDKLFVFYIWNQ